ncbi:MAG: hypothetical protein ACK4QW_15590 [Alphaproteobacteria bacterium]
MSRVDHLKTSFIAGELAPDLLGRGEIAAYADGAARLRNVFIRPTGGVARRAGTRFVAPARGPGRLVAFEFNTEQTYLLVLTDGWIDVLRDGEPVASVASPWAAAHLAQLAWTQSADTLLVVHPDLPPRRVTRTAETDWTVVEWSFTEEEGRLGVPFHRFGAPDVTLTPSAATGSITLTASGAHFLPAHAGQRFRLKRRQVEIDAVLSPTEATATVKDDLEDTDAAADWDEAAVSPVRGWPATVCFHQDRLVLGGSRDLPNRLWLSRSGDLFNFDLGTGLDDEAIEFPILSDQVNAIRAVFSGRHLQVFTSGAEWMVTGEPVTPAALQLRRQTRVGSIVARQVPPRDVDGATLFAARNGRELREFLFADIEQAYQAMDLALLARHAFRDPVDQDYDPAERLFHVVLANGTLATLTVYRGERVTAWTFQSTEGAFRAVAVAGDAVWLLVERADEFLIETFDADLLCDSALAGDSEAPASLWGGLDHLEGRRVRIVADGTLRPDAVVVGGTIELDAPARHVAAGLAYSHEIEPLPPAFGETGLQGRTWRPVEIAFRLLDTGALRLDLGRGFADLPFRRIGPTGVLDGPAPRFTGDRRVRAVGWQRGEVRPVWRIVQDAPLPCTILSVNTRLQVND